MTLRSQKHFAGISYKLSVASLNRMIAKVDATGSADKRYGGGMPRTAHSTENMYAFEAHTYIELSLPT